MGGVYEGPAPAAADVRLAALEAQVAALTAQVAANKTATDAAILTEANQRVAGDTAQSGALNDEQSGRESHDQALRDLIAQLLGGVGNVAMLKDQPRWTGTLATGPNYWQGSDPAVVIARDVDDTVHVSGHGFSDSSVITRGQGLAYNSFESRFQVGGTGNYDHFAGFQVNGQSDTTGRINEWLSFFSAPILNGPVTNYYGYAVISLRGTGVIDNAYGLIIRNLDRGTNRWGVFQEGAADKNFFAGRTDVANFFRVTGNGSVPTTGVGVEINFNPGYNADQGAGNIIVADRGANTYKPLFIDALEHHLRIAGFDILVADALKIRSTHRFDVANFFRVTGNATVPPDGVGVEINFNAAYNAGQGAGNIIAADRANNTFKALFIDALEHHLRIQGTDVVVITAAGLSCTGVVGPGAKTLAQLPDPSTVPGAIAWASNLAGGAGPLISDGANWRRFTLGAVAS